MPSVAKKKPTSARDVELAQANAEIMKARASIDRWRYLGNAFTFAVSIASTTLPILALAKALKPFAGESTEINASIVVSVSIVATLTVGGGALVKIISQRRTIKRLRKRVDGLERGRL